MLDEAPHEIVFEGEEADAFVKALERGTASAEYLREADELFAPIYSRSRSTVCFRIPLLAERRLKVRS